MAARCWGGRVPNEAPPWYGGRLGPRRRRPTLKDAQPRRSRRRGATGPENAPAHGEEDVARDRAMRERIDAMLRQAGLGSLGTGMGVGRGADGEGVLPLDVEGKGRVGPLEPTQVHEMMGLGGWRLGQDVHPVLAAVGAQIEGAWREFGGEDLRWLPPPGLFEEDVDYRLRALSLRLHEYADTLGVAAFYDALDSGADDKAAFDAEREAWQRDSGATPAPPPADGGPPPTTRFRVENRAYSTPVFRRLHMELAVETGGSGLSVLHVVMWPRKNFDVPIFGLDIVARKGGTIGFAIADVSPVTLNRQLPAAHAAALDALLREYDMEEFTLRALSDPTAPPGPAPRVPAWAEEIFSDGCVLLRPGKDADRVERFAKYATVLARTHLELTSKWTELPEEKATLRDQTQEAVRRYAAKQRENARTRDVLAAHFGEVFADRYLEEVLFDV